MRVRMWFFCASLALFAGSNARLAGQSCFTYTSDYAIYTQVSADDTNLYTTVLVDGSGSMNITGGNGCSGINYGSAVHTPMAVNEISYGGSYVGGMQWGEGGWSSCYLSEQNDQTIAVTPGVQYTFNWGGTVACSLGGSIVSWNGSSLITLSTTYGVNSLGSQVILDTRYCGYTPNCSSGTPTCGNPSWTVMIPKSNSCSSYIRNRWGSVNIDGELVCIGKWFVADGPGPCD